MKKKDNNRNRKENDWDENWEDPNQEYDSLEDGEGEDQEYESLTGGEQESFADGERIPDPPYVRGKKGPDFGYEGEEPEPGYDGEEEEPDPGLYGEEEEPDPDLYGDEEEPDPGLYGEEEEPDSGLYGDEEESDPGYDEEDSAFDEEEELSGLTGDRNPFLLIAGGVLLLAVIVVLCVVIWKMSHKQDETGGIPDQTQQQTISGEDQTGSSEAGESESGSSASESRPGESGEAGDAVGGGQASTGSPVDGGAAGGMQHGDESGAEGGSGAAVTMTFEDIKEKVTAKIETNLRSEPSTASDDTVVAVLKNGQTAVRTGINHDTGWSRLEYEGQTLYAVNRFLTTELTPAGDGSGTTASTDQPGPDRVTNEGVNGEAAGGQNNADNGGNTDTVVSGDPNAVVTKDGRTIVFTDCDDTVSPKEEVNLRGEPSTSQGNASVHVRLGYGENVRRTGISEDSGWSRVEYNGEVLYAVTSYLYVPEE